MKEAKEVLISGALTMAKHHEVACATELTRMLLNLYTEEHTVVSKESIGSYLYLIIIAHSSA